MARLDLQGLRDELPMVGGDRLLDHREGNGDLERPVGEATVRRSSEIRGAPPLGGRLIPGEVLGPFV